ncbi:ABC transporter permease [Corynebacterium breve]|uniref:ABC transporter permease n=1 Tax=Corynebacterium breve TaxID=3049799 RepID=A0ABY8VG73_9CORY|nr:ABC transporter permease [Corynebacterium breve]WIM67765.1 ABC transporter permease [Corynebacterium breve]
MNTTTTYSHVDKRPENAPPRRGSSARRIRALIVAELRQFLANRTLLFMAVLPLLMSFVLYALISRQTNETTGLQNTLSDVLIPFVLLFVQFYPVISAATTRRDEKVLKRLRTGESRDHEILGALAVPGTILSLLTIAAYSVFVIIDGAPSIDNLFLLVAAVLLGLVVSATAGLITASFTKNAEAAQMTSMPVFLIALLAMPGLRRLFPDKVIEVIEYTPFALVYDLALASWLDAPTLTAALSDLGVLTAWAIVLVWCATCYFKWETNR